MRVAAARRQSARCRRARAPAANAHAVVEALHLVLREALDVLEVERLLRQRPPVLERLQVLPILQFLLALRDVDAEGL